MNVARLEQRSYIKIAVLRGKNSRECHSKLVELSVRNGTVPHGFHKLSVALSIISHSQYGYFDVGTLFMSNDIYFAGRLTYNWVSIALSVLAWIMRWDLNFNQKSWATSFALLYVEMLSNIVTVKRTRKRLIGNNQHRLEINIWLDLREKSYQCDKMDGLWLE